MQNSPPWLLITKDAVLAKAIPEQIAHYYGISLSPSADFGFAFNSPSSELAIIDLASDAEEQLTALRVKHPLMALALIAAEPNQAGSPVIPLAELLPRPLSMRGLCKAIDRLLIKRDAALSQQDFLLASDLLYRPAGKLLACKGRTIELTDKESALLHCLYHNRQDWLARETLLQAVWGYGGGMDTHTLETHLYRLRGKLKEIGGDAEFILSRQGQYRLNPNMQ